MTAYRLATTDNDNMERQRTNPRCAACEQPFNAINGVYCPKVQKYINYATTPPCESQTI